MKKNLIKFSTGLLVFSLLLGQTAFANFSDVSEDHQNFEAINYLKENKIINGYEDGTFKPDQNVNRAEFLKIIIEGSNITPGINKATPFPDVDHTAWYAPYIKHAFASGWINGYPDGIFKPDQTINKVEALKILAKAQNWLIDPLINNAPYSDTPTEAWYTPYINYAKTAGYLEETDNLFGPSEQMQRGGISQIIYKTLAVEEQNETDLTPEPEPEAEPEEAPASEEEEIVEEPNFTPINFQLVSKDFFTGISLDEDLPNHLYKNEVYVVKGTLANSTTSNATVIVNSKDKTTQLSFSGEVSNKKFAIPVHFRKSGNYVLGIISGESGTSIATEISVLKELPTIPANAITENKPTGLNINYQDDKTKVSFPGETATLTKLIFNQSNRSVTYLSRQNLGEIVINYQDFANFTGSEVTYHIETAELGSTKPLQISTQFTAGDSKKFNPIQHSFDSIEQNNINSNPQDKLDTPQTVKITGTVKTKAKITSYITKPDGFVDTVELFSSSPYNSELISANGDFSLTYNINDTGRYIFEINNENGAAIMNHPIYVGEYIPLLPDFLDLHQKKLFEGAVDLDELRQDLLDEINKSRQEHGLKEISLSDEINDVAQAHAEDMKENDFFAHNNLNGETPEDRRIKAGITTSVSENLSRDVDIPSAHYGLMRSGAHRKNILEKDWTRVGFGIIEDQDYLLIAEEFSTTAVTQNDLMGFRDELITAINQKRVEDGKSPLNTTEALDNTAKYLNDKNILENKTLTNGIFEEATSANNIPGTSQAIARIFNIWDDILNSILEEKAAEITSGNWKLLGVDIQLDKEGKIHAITILNNPI